MKYCSYPALPGKNGISRAGPGFGKYDLGGGAPAGSGQDPQASAGHAPQAAADIFNAYVGVSLLTGG